MEVTGLTGVMMGGGTEGTDWWGGGNGSEETTEPWVEFGGKMDRLPTVVQLIKMVQIT